MGNMGTSTSSVLKVFTKEIMLNKIALQLPERGNGGDGGWHLVP